MAENPEYAAALAEKGRRWREKKAAENPEYYKKLRERISNWRKERLKKDPTYREQLNKTCREYQKRRKAEDPEYREKYRKRMKAWRDAHKNDPEYIAKRRGWQRKYAEKRLAALKAKETQEKAEAQSTPSTNQPVDRNE